MKKITFLFAHGAGADSQSEFMQTMALLLNCEQIEVKRLDFPYMQRRKVTGKKSPPDRMEKLQHYFIKQIAKLDTDNLFIGGKSMGGRVATMIAEQVKAKGIICFGYPFHPPGKPEKIRTAHLQSFAKPCLILQGTRDTFGKPEEVTNYNLSSNIQIEWLQDANHNLETLKRSEVTTEQSWQLAADKARQFMFKLG